MERSVTELLTFELNPVQEAIDKYNEARALLVKANRIYEEMASEENHDSLDHEIDALDARCEWMYDHRSTLVSRVKSRGREIGFSENELRSLVEYTYPRLATYF